MKAREKRVTILAVNLIKLAEVLVIAWHLRKFCKSKNVDDEQREHLICFLEPYNWLRIILNFKLNFETQEGYLHCFRQFFLNL